ncbi:2-oxoacid:acceptor oxidoreductase family protein [Lutispora sp.]|uniref:2-oxoacid:acceptor oxidoreductase family protein n=1 Tax=Lutispora sp. TaxID=2828727 RepID=UPI002B20DE6F|nr:2-oxoacid:acceptor oxidoreductase family protein [Lutispora sp.]MEA4962223.1 2-oxoacid:acceptor oxidoreductase family protein [Lutispora sp.]
MGDKLDVIVCGIGGQGIVLANRIVSQVLFGLGIDVKSTDIIGIGQRGGAVISHIRAGDRVLSPLIKKKSADIMIAFERYEALRWADYLHDDGIMIINDHSILPNSIEMRLQEDIDYGNMFDELKCRKFVVNTDSILKKNRIGNKYANICLLGVFSNCTNANESLWMKAIEHIVGLHSLKKNLEAFCEGRRVGHILKVRGV